MSHVRILLANACRHWARASGVLFAPALFACSSARLCYWRFMVCEFALPDDSSDSRLCDYGPDSTTFEQAQECRSLRAFAARESVTVHSFDVRACVARELRWPTELTFPSMAMDVRSADHRDSQIGALFALRKAVRDAGIFSNQRDVPLSCAQTSRW